MKRVVCSLRSLEVWFVPGGKSGRPSGNFLQKQLSVELDRLDLSWILRCRCMGSR